MLLKKFSVRNYKSFKGEMTIDFSKSREYTNLSSDVFLHVDQTSKIAKHSLLYGYNGSGKSSLCLAIMDISMQLTDNERLLEGFFFNLDGYKKDSRNNYAFFTYTFDLDGVEMIYKYTKADVLDLAREELYYDGKPVFKYSFADLKDENVVNIPGLDHVAFADLNTKTSMLRYIFTACNFGGFGISELISFANGMLYFRSANDGNHYAGLQKGISFVFDEIASNNLAQEFQKFLSKASVDYKIGVLPNAATGKATIGALFSGGWIALSQIASSGTKVLALFFYWMHRFDKTSLIIIDEFDAYYHDRLTEMVYSIISHQNAQTLVTTHNTSLLSYDHSRPDCIFIINGKRTENLATIATELGMKEIRKGNNLKNLYERFSEEMR